MTCYNTQHSKNHENPRQNTIALNIQKVAGCYSRPLYKTDQPKKLFLFRNVHFLFFTDPSLQ